MKLNFNPPENVVCVKLNMDNEVTLIWDGIETL